MTFPEFWSKLQSNLISGSLIRNWTMKKAYLGDQFKIISVAATHVEVDSPEAETIQRVSRKDFEIMFDNWNSYCSGELQRKKLVSLTRVSKYTMSILKHLNV